MLKRVLPIIVLIFSLLLFFHPVLKGQVPFPGDLLVGNYAPWNSYSHLGYTPGGIPHKAQGIDVIRQLYPWKKLAIEQFVSSQWPLWNPYNFSGNPLLANFQSAVFYPLNLVLFLPFNIGWTIFIILQPLLGFLFMYLFLRQKKLSSVSSILGSLAFSYSLYMIVWLEWSNVGHTLIWLPLILFTIGKLKEKFSFLWLSLYSLAIVFAILAGYFQLIIYIFLITFFYYLYQHFDLINYQTFIKKTLVLCFFTLLAIGVCSIQLIPSLEIFLNSARNIYSGETISKLLMPWFNIVTLFVPDFYGNPAHRNYWLEGTYIERVSYVGIIPLLFSFYSLISRKKGTVFFIAIAIISLLLAVNFFPAQLFYNLQIPIIGTTVPTRILAILSFSLAVLGAYGFEEFIQQKKYHLKIFLILPVVFITIWMAVLALSVSSKWLPEFILTTKKNLFLSSLILSVSTVMIITAVKFTKWKKYLIWVLVAITIFDLYIFFQRITPFSSQKFIYPQTKIMSLLKNNGSFWRFWGYGSGYIESNFATEEKVFTTDGYDPLYIKRYGELVSSSDKGNIKNPLPRSDVVIAPGYGEESLRDNLFRKRVLDILGVRYILHKNEKEKNHDTATFPSDRYKLIYQEGFWQIYENLEVVPRFFLTTDYVVEKDNKKIIKLLLDPNFDPHKTLILETDPKIFADKNLNNGVQIMSYLPNEVRFKTNSKRPSLLFLSDNYYPGWKVTVDGSQKEIYRADYTFRAVVIPKGEHEVIFSYKPDSFFVGLKITIAFLLIFLIVVTYAVVKKYMIKSYLSKNIALIFISLLALIGVRALFHAGFFPSHDGEWMVIRFTDFHRSLVDGQWPVRWAGRLNFGFGYPVFNFLYPGTFYLTEIFHLLKLNFVNSVKASFIVSYLLSGIFMFLFTRQWWGKWGGLAAAVLYLYTPYRFVDMYVRGSLGESVAYMFPPLIFLAITKLSKTAKASNNLLWVVVGSLGIAGMVTTHNVIAYLFLPIIFGFMMVLFYQTNNRKMFTANCFLLTVLGLGLASFFWIPALWDKQYTIFDKVVVADFSQNFASLRNLLLPSWGYGPSRPGDPGSMSFQIGIINITTIIISLLLLFTKKINKIVVFFIVVTLLAIFFMTNYSQVFWQYIPGLSLIQFPWRILSVTTFTTAFLAGYIVTTFKNKQFILAVIVIVLPLLFNFRYIKPSQFVDRGEGYYATNDDTTTVQKEYLPIGANNLYQKRAASKVEIISGQGTINNLITKSNKTDFIYQGTAGLLKINTVYFPGWEVLVNGQKQDIVVDKQGLMNIEVSGDSNILFRFKETPLRKIADLIAIVSMIITGVLFVIGITRQKILV